MTTVNLDPHADIAIEIRESARTMLSALSPLSRLRALRGSLPGYERTLWASLAEAGWTGVFVDEALGGMGLGLSAAQVIAQEVGKNPIPEPYMAGAWHASLILSGLPVSELRDALLADIASGARVIGVAHSRSRALDVTDAPLVVASESTCVVRGNAHGVYPARADGWLVVTDSCDVFWVPEGTDNLQVNPHERVDGSFSATLNFDNLVLPRDYCLANGSMASKACTDAQSIMRCLQGAELLGVAQAAFDKTLDYLKTRTQFGKPIGANQALQHRMVDAYLQLRLAHATLAQGVASLTTDSAESDSDQIMAISARIKARCAFAAQHITRLAIQFHGAIGYTDELDIGLFLKRMLHLISWLGGVKENRRLAAKFNVDAGHTHSDRIPYDNYSMDTDWNQLSESEFRAVVRDFVARNYPEQYRHPVQRLHWHEIKEWYMALSRQGWIAPAWPRSYGGMGLSPTKLIAFIEEMEAYGVARTPDQGIINIGPVLIRYGNQEQQNHFLPKILSGEHIWCQGYSEPNAGSDLASLRTEAIDDGDVFVVNGQKIWTTLAQDATHIFLLVRTDKTVKKQAGISFLLADMSTPGITVRPIENIGGEHEFCEVFFDNVRVPKDNLVGSLNQGWSIAKALLDFERLFVGSPSQARYALNQLRVLAEHNGSLNDASFVDFFNEALLDVMDLEALYGEYVDIVKRGEPLPVSVSLLKIWATETYSRLCMAAVETAGDAGGDAEAISIENLQLVPVKRLYNASITTIYGGTNEIQRNILAKLVLELPS